MTLQDIPTPAVGPGQVLVRIHAAGVNPFDTYMRAGTYAIKPPLPYTPGADGAGVVEAVGAGITRFKAGDRVFTGKTVSGAYGSYAEYAVALESQVHVLPDKVSFAQGAAVWVAYYTAFTALRHHAEARAGETVLIHGASGGVGIAAVQIARSMGLTVLGTAGSKKGIDLASTQGAHMVFDHSKPGYTEDILKATSGRGLDIVLEMLANVNLAADLKMLAQRGRVIVIGNRGEITINPRELMSRRASVRAFTLWAATDAESVEIDAAVRAGLENGSLRPVVGKELPLKDAPQAHIDVMAQGAYGKIVLVP